MMRPTCMALSAMGLMALSWSPSRAQTQAGGEDPKKVVLVEVFTSQG